MATEKTVIEGGETQSEIDMEAATAEISSDLFGQDKEAKVEKPAEGQEEVSTETSGVETPPAQSGEEKPVEAKPDEENSAAVQETGAPKTWTKEALETWATIPDRAKQEIIKREEDFMKGISMYKQAAEVGAAYDQVVEPYRAILNAENINPVKMFEAFAGNHYLLSRGTPEQKVQLAAQLLEGYRIPLEAVAAYIGDRIISPPNPEVEALRRELTEIKTGMGQQTQAQIEAAHSQILESVNSFADDGKHPYFDEVGEYMSRLIETGSAKDLQDAYDQAVWANPTTREKELARIDAEKKAAQADEEKARRDKKARLTADHVETIPRNRNGTAPLGTIDETLEATLRDIQSRAT